MNNAGALAALNIDNIVGIVNPPDNTNLLMNNILLAISGVFAIAPIGLTFVRTTLKFPLSMAIGSQIIENAVFAYPAIGRNLFPKGDTESKIIQMAALKDSLGDVLQQGLTNLNTTCVDAMANVDAFLAFAAQGNFTYSLPSLADQTNYLYYAFNTYVISAGLTGNDIHATYAHDTNPQQLATNGTKLNYEIDCASYNEQNICDAWWYSNATNKAWGLNDFAHANRNWGDGMTKLFEKYTTPDLLFENALSCQLQGADPVGTNLTANAAGVNTACLSQLKVLSWDPFCHDHRDRSCEFMETESQNGFLREFSSHSMWSVMDVKPLTVPYCYLGPLITQTKVELQRE